VWRTPSPHPNPLAAFDALILVPSALDFRHPFNKILDTSLVVPGHQFEKVATLDIMCGPAYTVLLTCCMHGRNVTAGWHLGHAVQYYCNCRY
jgi:hypothetical protein